MHFYTSYFILKSSDEHFKHPVFRDVLCNKSRKHSEREVLDCYLNHPHNWPIADQCKVLLITALYYLPHCQPFIKPTEGNSSTMGNSGPVPNYRSDRAEPSPALLLSLWLKSGIPWPYTSTSICTVVAAQSTHQGTDRKLIRFEGN